ncbi:transcription termination/antitermination NusG family protein [Bradyrhizobium manausense]|uniref:transcription termination/antitermination protein NusG n=1 Tax=Bradyrhizobium manausense TaxID=989370 RepID=UPI001BA9A34C|nr:transcription termination/antitermination NusG family protein [Bradyrhizobium manausense]MBR0687331.1 transcription termination/antitermination NusG family protein [Bradyrhizobium manausense]
MKPLSDELSPEVRAELSRPVMTFDPRNAQIVAGKTPKWHLLEVYEPAQRDVADQLAERRFGVFVPRKEEIAVSRGRKFSRKQWLFPGYVFVFVWDIEQHWSLISATPGVSRIMASAPRIDVNDPSHTPHGLPNALVIDDVVIDKIRAVENGEQPQPSRKRRNRGKNKHDDEVVATYPWSPFPDRWWMLDSEGRNQTLRQALGLS